MEFNIEGFPQFFPVYVPIVISLFLYLSVPLFPFFLPSPLLFGSIIFTEKLVIKTGLYINERVRFRKLGEEYCPIWAVRRYRMFYLP